MQRHQVRCLDPILALHLADHELGIAADDVAFRARSSSYLVDVLEEKDERDVLGNVVASQGTRWRLQVGDLADDLVVTDGERRFHPAFRPELVPRAGAIKIATNPVPVCSVHDPRSTPQGLELRCRLAHKGISAFGVRRSAEGPTTLGYLEPDFGEKVEAARSRPPLEKVGPSRSTRSRRPGRNIRRRNTPGPWARETRVPAKRPMHGTVPCYLLLLGSRQVHIFSLPQARRWRKGRRARTRCCTKPWNPP